MIRLSLKVLAARRARTLLSAVAIVLGVGVITAAFTLSDTLRHAADSLTSSAYKGTDAVVDARTSFKVSTDGNASQPTIPAALLDRVRALPQVAVAAGDLTNNQTRIVDARGKTVGDGPFFGVGHDAAAPGADRLTPLHLTAGRFATTADRVVIDAGTASRQHVKIGDRIRISARGPARSFAISGIVKFGSVNDLGTSSIAVFALSEGQRLFGEQGHYDSILVAGRPGVSPAALRTALAAATPSTAQIQTATQQDRFMLDGLKQFISVIETVLLALGGVAIFVGSFTIFNTLSITVAQRSRELAMLRTVGASRRQVLGSVIVEAITIGVTASLVGLLAGVGLAQGLSSLLHSLGLDLPQAGTVFAAHTAIIAVVVGVLVTTVAGIAPALGATRISPVLAMRDGAVTQAGSSSRATRLGGVAGVLAGVLLAAGMFAGGVAIGARFMLIVPGCLLLFIAVALLSRRIAARLASLLGRPAQRFAGEGGALARRNAMRNPARTASTAAALMIGIALVVFVSSIGAGLRQSTTQTLARQISASYVVGSDDGFSPIDGGADAALHSDPAVASSSAIAQDQIQVSGQTLTVNGVDPATIARAYRYTWQRGSSAATLQQLGGNGAIVDRPFATQHHLTVGSVVDATLATGGRLHLVVRGIDVPPKWGALGLGPVTVSAEAFHAAFPLARNRLAFVSVTRPDAATLSGLRVRLAGYPGVKVMTPQTFAKAQMSWVGQTVAIIDVLLALAVLVSLLGIVNTLALSIIERTRELGMLRAVGMTRRQVRRMIRHESVITALLGAALGIAVGISLAALVTVALRGQGLQFAVPIGSIVAFVVVAVMAGMVAAIGPARRAARLQPLAALAYE